MKRIIACVILIAAILAGSVYADTICKVNIPVRYVVTDGASVESIFTLKALGDSPMPEGSSGGEKKVTMSQRGSFDFGEIAFTKAGEYEYKVSKVTMNQPGLTSDDTVYDIRFLVREDGTYTSVIQREGHGEKLEEIIYSDTVIKHTPKACYDDPPVLKIVEGKEDSQEEFTFRFRKVSSTTGYLPMPDGITEDYMDATVKAGEEKEFGIVEFTEAGEYNYEILEIDTKIQGYTYDKRAYQVNYTVTEKDGELQCIRTVRSGDRTMKMAVFEFVNVYNDPSLPPSGDPEKPVPPIVEKIQKSTPYQKTIGKITERITKTGDSFNPFIMLVTALISLVGIGIFFLERRGEKKTEEKS